MEMTLTNIVNGVILNATSNDRIVANWVANEAYLVADPDQVAPLQVRYGCTEHMKQIARQILRRKMEPSTAEEVEAQGTLWDLQSHYPACHKDSDGESVYLSRHIMSWADIVYNHDRMDNAGDTLKAHAKRLLQYGMDRGLKSMAA